jgi:PucR family transcriptional regulator, purine catabolism regulatory protein
MVVDKTASSSQNGSSKDLLTLKGGDPIALTVGELVAVPHLRTRVLAGHDGLDRLVTWAHSVEVPDPWHWLGEHDLLMTAGYSIPADSAGQVAFMTNLDKAGISAIAIGEDQKAPPITEETKAAVDALGFPILLTPYEVPFVAMGREVADATQRARQRLITQTARLYERMRAGSAGGAESRDLLQGLADELGADLYVLDCFTGRRLLSEEPLPDRYAETLPFEVWNGATPSPAVTRIEVPDGPAMVLPLPSTRQSAVLVVPRSQPPPLQVLQHLSTILALEVERATNAEDESRRHGAALLVGLLDGTANPASAREQLADAGFNGGAMVIAAMRRSPRDGNGKVARALSATLQPALIHETASTRVVLMAAHATEVEALRDAIGAETPVGLSDPFPHPEQVRDGIREATWALEAASRTSSPMVRYGESAPMFLPKTLTEAQAVAERVLGPVLLYDSEHGTDLLRSLVIFLVSNRSWLRAAKTLFIHKQTLVYRMRRVQDLTERKLDQTGDVAELWLALRAHGDIDEAGLPAERP